MAEVIRDSTLTLRCSRIMGYAEADVGSDVDQG
jgi:hypothetical protein